MQPQSLFRQTDGTAQDPRPRLLVSVRDAVEAETAVRTGAEWIDVKEPDHGPLGRAEDAVIREVVEVVRSRMPVSAALGELTDLLPADAARTAAIPGLQLVKIGLAGTATDPNWADRWYAVLDALRAHAAVAAVAYADWQAAGAPRPETVVRYAAGRCAALLVDTYDKFGPSLPNGIPWADLQNLLALARAAGMRIVLAGRLTVDSYPRLLPLEPDLIAVRGAVCAHGRNASIAGDRVRAFRQSLDHSTTPQRNA